MSSSFLLLCFYSLSLSAQNYKAAVGIRLGTEVGITGQFRIGERSTLEGMLQTSFRYPSSQFSVLYERHYPIITKGLNMYLGVGPHIGWYAPPETSQTDIKFGISPIAGAELTLGKLNFSWDMKPTINLVGGYRILELETAISVRYILVKRSKNSKSSNWKFWERNSSGSKKRGRSGKA
ncbi:MAG: hypothetical protein IPI60_12930 [Saprospiraceae bacterium]|nr:hypothetical protein [Saprospiraceae bacterium]